MTKYLSRDALLAARPPEQDIDIPELGGAVRVRGLTASERAEIEALVVDVDPATQEVRYNAEGAKRANLMLAAFGLITPEGEQMFNPHSADDLKLLGNLSGAVLGRIADAVRDLSGMGEAAEKKEHA